MQKGNDNRHIEIFHELNRPIFLWQFFSTQRQRRRRRREDWINHLNSIKIEYYVIPIDRYLFSSFFASNDKENSSIRFFLPSLSNTSITLDIHVQVTPCWVIFCGRLFEVFFCSVASHAYIFPNIRD